ncbi:MAG: leucyl aminopeptidase family protein [Bacteroidales bacterium]|jgi:leucyl aminopeptidase|nr:leucyl aminopeptidase family protein [Bacteroidales bacterium]
MIRLEENKDPVKGDRVLLATPSCAFEHYGLTQQDADYVRRQIGFKSKQIPVRTDKEWIFVQTVDHDAPEQAEMESLRCGAAAVHEMIRQQQIGDITVVNAAGREAWAFAFAEGLVLTNYQFLKYVGKKEERQYSLKRVILAGVSSRRTDEMNCVLEAVCKTRDLVNEPACVMTAVRLAAEIQEMAAETGLSVQVLNKTDIEALQMGGMLAVNRGSVEAPTFTILEWHPENARNREPVVLAGKGLVYDTGGHSLKPTANSMDCMKCDMSGGAAVAATLCAVAKAGLPVHVIGLVPSTDNRLSASAYSPGDIITMCNGTTVEVLNTDAEGRLILADALLFAKKYNPELVIDIATLTGAAHRAIGEKAIVGMGNARRETMNMLIECGNTVFERIAEFPFWNDYAESLKSDIADLKNIGGELAGAITAGKFLEHFTDYPYIHLDIAGPAYLKNADKYRPAGGTGVGVRLLFEFLKTYSSTHHP